MGVWRRVLSFVLAAGLYGVVVVAAPAGAQSGPAPVVDPSGVLSEEERAFLTNAVRDARQRTPYLATVFVVSDLDGRDPEVLVEEIVRPPQDGGQVPMTMVVSPGSPPEVTVVVPPGDAERLAEEVDHATSRARSEAAANGLPAAGLGFTSAIIAGPPQPAEVPGWLITLAFLILCVSGWRTFREWRRVRLVPNHASELASVDGRVIMATGQIAEAPHTFSMLGVGQLVFFRAEQHWTVPTFTRWRDGYGNSWYEDGPNRHESDVESDSVPFLLVDGTGGGAWVHPAGADVRAPVLDKRGWTFSDSSSKISGLRLGDWVTVVGPCRPQPDGAAAFVGNRRSGSDVIVLSMDPKSAYRSIRRGLWKRFAWTGFWLVVFVLVSTAQVA